jgi:16S rRNA (cytidine1402-2'-O)-methyltransferase
MAAGTLFVVATPIGHLGDLTERARTVLSAVSLIAVEDSRRTAPLVASLGVSVPLVPYHEHNGEARTPQLLARLQAGDDIALVSDAGTPLIADPGYRLVRAARAEGIAVVPVPGASAVMAALSVAGLPTDRFTFRGFLPAKAGARRRALEALASLEETQVFFEAPHRIVAMLEDAAATFGAEREAYVGRELTKRFESHYRGSLGELLSAAREEALPARGEFVVVLAGAPEAATVAPALQEDHVLRLLLEELPPARAARVAAALLAMPKKPLYQRALALAEGREDA